MPTAEASLSTALAGFAPSAGRARVLDERMRERLAASLRYVCEEAGAHLDVDRPSLEGFLKRLAEGPVSPLAFACYAELVVALESGELDPARALLRELVRAPRPGTTLEVRALRDPAFDPDSARYQRLIGSEPEAPFQLLPPPPEQVGPFRERIDQAFALLDAGHPELATELRALLREIVLAVGPDGPDAAVFDGASSFMLWGGILLNASSHRTRLAMVQALAHEAGHNLLFGLSADGKLVEGADDQRFDSPLRADPRPLDGILHATFVCARMHLALEGLLASDVLSDEEAREARRALAGHAEAFARGLEVLDAQARLTEMGGAVLAGARAYMDGAAQRPHSGRSG